MGRVITYEDRAKDYGVIPEIRILEAYTTTDRPKLTDAVLFVYPE